jgi:hypothetical protein
MNRRHYQDALLRLYCEQPDTPATASRADWAIAADLYRRGIPWDKVAHAIRLATLRRLRREPDAEPLRPILSLAYYRRVLDSLTAADLEPGYLAYVEQAHTQTLQRLKAPPAKPTDSKARPDSQNAALWDRR